MGNFCKYCGKPLVNGACDCPGFLAENQTVTQNVNVEQPVNMQPDNQQVPPNYQQVQPNYQQVPPNYQQAQPNYQQVPPNYQQVQPNFQQQAAKEQLNKSKVLFMKFLKSPVGMMSEVAGGGDKTSPLILGGLHLLVIILALLIRIPEMDMNEKLPIALKIAIVVGGIDLVNVALVFIAAQIMKLKASFRDYLCIFCLATIPSSLLCIAGLLFTYISIPLSIIILLMALVSWIILLTEATTVSLGVGKDLAFWIAMAVMAIVVLVCYLVAKQYVVSAIEDAAYGVMGGLGGLGDLMDMY
ncbi:MAG: hypothetical protein PHP50_10975 [Lachnospiraceae bacterium]|nr:hypothetical protein [Lachnospiraceae bacterium]